MATIATKRLVLITGANGGIGFELAAQLMKKGSYHVLLGSRSLEKGNAAVTELQSRELPGSVELLEIDVTNDDTIERAASSVQRNHGKLDILVNNAGISAMSPPFRQQMRDAFDTNATGPACMSIAFAHLLRKSTASPRIVNISSGVGSIARRLDTSSPMYKAQHIQYRASKTALSMVTACHFVEFGPEIKVFAYDPGFTVSSLGPHNNIESGARSAADSVMPLIDVLEGKRDDEAGKLLHNTGVYPW
ncbi:putative short-chain dehydrogenase [Lindgomyces ingoldianus]|uniref:Short-chain dehydrogenase n=1 Tax=Lindgomyces ingoldianus TaxID=673940 RepID=A0ACB6QNW1_9PLEO|nr:putative short-chain dehydrogenase [Lindgomyces ingoldianus]KAF2468601.1 putative short-chain dehydrogenase [Lindgomyces ingoldianus]